MFQALPLFAKILIVLAVLALYIVLILYAAKFCAFNDTPPQARRNPKVPFRRAEEGAPLPAPETDG